MLRVYVVMGTLPLPRQVAWLCAEQHQRRKFFACQRVRYLAAPRPSRPQQISAIRLAAPRRGDPSQPCWAHTQLAGAHSEPRKPPFEACFSRELAHYFTLSARMRY